MSVNALEDRHGSPASTSELDDPIAEHVVRRSGSGAALVPFLSSRAVAEGLTPGGAGTFFYRVSRPTTFRKTAILGPRLIVVAQGKKIGRFPAGELVYDEDHFLVLTAETEFDGIVVEASPDRPYLAMCMELAPDIVAKTLLALADADVPISHARAGRARTDERLPAFVSELTKPFTDVILRLLHALEDPLETQVLAPLALEELAFRLLRTDAAAVMRDAVREGDASIQVAMRYIRDNARTPLTVPAIARHVGMSASHFAHRFSAVARVSPMRFLKRVRLEAARELLLGQSVRVSEAALHVGYESASHFTRDFKLAYGAAPAEYLRRIRAGG